MPDDRILAFGKGKCVDIPYELAHHAFERMVEINPDLVAVEHGNESITYGVLNEKANTMASKLISIGLQVGDYVGVLTVRSIDMIIGYLAVLKAGGAFISLDSELPLERLMK
ncbi:hypothetical protein HDV02_003688, partial [Globomyces sp. JEL0801]